MTIVFIIYCLLNYNETDEVNVNNRYTEDGNYCHFLVNESTVQVILSLVSVMVLIVVGPNQVIAGISWLREQLMIAEAQLAANISPREPQPITKRLSRKNAISVITVHREVR